MFENPVPHEIAAESITQVLPCAPLKPVVQFLQITLLTAKVKLPLILSPVTDVWLFPFNSMFLILGGRTLKLADMVHIVKLVSEPAETTGIAAKSPGVV
jgi:hypothetical protein